MDSIVDYSFGGILLFVEAAISVPCLADHLFPFWASRCAIYPKSLTSEKPSILHTKDSQPRLQMAIQEVCERDLIIFVISTVIAFMWVWDLGAGVWGKDGYSWLRG